MDKKKALQKETKRVIIVGSEGHAGIVCTSWDTKIMPNLADYDDVIVETSSLGSLLLRSKEMPDDAKALYLHIIYANIAYVNDRLLNVLKSKGTVYTICSETVIARSGGSPFSFITSYSWMPLAVRVLEEAGETISLVDKSLEHYFQFVAGWSRCFEALDLSDENRERIIKLEGGGDISPRWMPR